MSKDFRCRIYVRSTAMRQNNEQWLTAEYIALIGVMSVWGYRDKTRQTVTTDELSHQLTIILQQTQTTPTSDVISWFRFRLAVTDGFLWRVIFGRWTHPVIFIDHYNLFFTDRFIRNSLTVSLPAENLPL